VLRFSAVFVEHLAKAVEAEVSALEKIGGSVCGKDEWPDDYDPNDLAYYRGVLVEKQGRGGMNIDDPLTKPVEFLMKLIPRYARNNRSSIAPDDLAAIHDAYSRYVGSVCLARMPEILQQPSSSYVGQVEWLLKSLVDFPSAGSS
jgi:hypothetical protein